MEPVYDPLLGSATTVVMKLLLLALDLKTERTKDSGHQLSTNLAHRACSGSSPITRAEVDMERSRLKSR